MREVFGAVIATALVLIAVFVPVAFFPGTTGRLYSQFSITIAFSVALSAFNALTLTPALSGLLLNRQTHGKGMFFSAVERVITGGTRAYVAGLRLGDAGPLGGRAAVLRRPRRNGVAVSHGAAGVRARRGRRLLHHPRPGAGRGLARVHVDDGAAGGADPDEGPRHRGGVLGHGLQLQRRGAESGPDLLQPEAVCRAEGIGPRAQGRAGAHRRTAVRASAGRSSCRSRRRRFPAWGSSAGSSSRCSTRRAATSTRWRRRPSAWSAPATRRRG